jgi:hypothetical protein
MQAALLQWSMSRTYIPSPHVFIEVMYLCSSITDSVVSKSSPTQQNALHKAQISVSLHDIFVPYCHDVRLIS